MDAHENAIFLFYSRIPFLSKFGLKNQNCLFKLKFGTKTNSNRQNSMMMFSFSDFDWKYPFMANIVQKNHNCHVSWNFVSWLIRVCKIKSWSSLFLFRLDMYPLWVHLVQKIKIVVLSWNFLPLLIRICRIQWWSLFFSVFDLKYSFLANMVQKIQIISLSWNLITKLIWTLTIQWWCSLFGF